MAHKVDDWHGLYSEGWQGEIVPEAFSHPAKFSRALIRRIYDHAAAEGWVEPGAVVVDPFGGVGLGSLDAMRLGLTWIGCELEPKFVDLGRANIELWAGRYGPHLPGWGCAHLLQGDSRQLGQRLAGAGLAVTSSPYAVRTVHGTSGVDLEAMAGHKPGAGSMASLSEAYGRTPGQLGNLPEGDHGAALAVSSPPYADSEAQQSHGQSWREELTDAAGSWRSLGIGYGRAHGQLGAMHEGDHGAALAVSSPPYADRSAAPTCIQGSGAGDLTMNEGDTYSKIPGQLGSMHEGNHRAALAVSSPPYMDGAAQQGTDNHPERMEGSAFAPARYDLAVSSPPFGEGETRDRAPVQGGFVADCIQRAYTQDRQGTTPGNLASMAVSSPQERQDRLGIKLGGGQLSYGTAPYSASGGNIGNDTGDTFWTAARTIVEQTYQVLKPGGHAVWVVKMFVRNKAIVDFPDQWRQLCEAVGFVTLHEHRAWLVEERGTQIDLFGNHHTKTVERKSFFRRLAESKGSPRIDWETVYCMVKP